jgi:hypothetical protein
MQLVADSLSNNNSSSSSSSSSKSSIASRDAYKPQQEACIG